MAPSAPRRILRGRCNEGEGLRPGNRAALWSKAASSSSAGRKMVVDQMRPREEAARCAKAVSQEKKGQWVKGENEERKKPSWRELRRKTALN